MMKLRLVFFLIIVQIALVEACGMIGPCPKDEQCRYHRCVKRESGECRNDYMCTPNARCEYGHCINLENNDKVEEMDYLEHMEDPDRCSFGVECPKEFPHCNMGRCVKPEGQYESGPYMGHSGNIPPPRRKCHGDHQCLEGEHCQHSHYHGEGHCVKRPSLYDYTSVPHKQEAAPRCHNNEDCKPPMRCAVGPLGMGYCIRGSESPENRYLRKGSHHHHETDPPEPAARTSRATQPPRETHPPDPCQHHCKPPKRCIKGSCQRSLNYEYR